MGIKGDQIHSDEDDGLEEDGTSGALQVKVDGVTVQRATTGLIVTGMKETGGQALAAGAIADGTPVERSGTTLVSGPKNNRAASVAPATTNDSTQGYSIGSEWLDTTADKSYKCLDATTNAAVWKETSNTAGGSGDVVGPASSTDNTIPRYSGTTGKLLDQAPADSPSIDDAGNIVLVAGRTVDGIDISAEVKKNNFAATVAPTINEDSGDGYAIGSRWLDTTADVSYECLDATVGAAVWKQTSNTAGGSGDVVGPSAVTDNAIARYSGTTGKALDTTLAASDAPQIDDLGNIVMALNKTVDGIDISLEVKKNNFSASTDPLTTTDSSAWYAVGARWFNTTLNRVWECLSAATNAAVWVSGPMSVFSNAVSGVAVRDVVAADTANDSTVVKAKANDAALIPPIGIVVSTPTTTTCVVAGVGAIITGFSGLVRGTSYYLSTSTAGAITAIIPIGSQYIVGEALSTTVLRVAPLMVDASGDFRYRSPRRVMTLQRHGSPGQTSIVAVGAAAPTSTGTLSSVRSADGMFLQYATTATLDNVAGWVFAGLDFFQRQELPCTRWVVRSGAAVALMRVWVGHYSAEISGSDNPAAHIAAFRYSTGAADTNWMAVVKDGTTINAVSTGVAVVANTKYKLDIDMSRSGFVDFYVNDVLTNSLSTNMPAVAQSLGWGFRLTTLSAAIKDFRFALAEANTN